MSRIIINIADGVDEMEAIERVRSVMRGGRICVSAGREQYCYVTSWHSGYLVYASTTKNGTDVFHVSLEKK